MAQLDLNALLATVRVQNRVNTSKQALKARVAQRTSADDAADAYARSLEKRNTLARALSSEGIDAMRFRFIAEHSHQLARLAGLTIDQMRAEVDLMIKQEAIRRLSEMRRREVLET